MKSPLHASNFAGRIFPKMGIGLCIVVLPLAMLAEESNPYSVIVERNIFRLTSPPPPPPPEKPKVDLPVVKITGFVDIGDSHKVLFQAESKGKKAEKLFYSLSEGEKSFDGKLELVKIHPSLDGVDVINDGTPATLTVKEDTLPPSSGAPAPAVSAPPNQPPGGNPNAPRPLFRRPPGQSPTLPPGFSFPGRPRRNGPDQ